jgi:hypothetical protein
MTAPLRDDLRSLNPKGVQRDQVGPSRTPARRWCPFGATAPAARPAWLLSDFHCPHDHALRQRYGITCDQWNLLLIVQRGRCAVCGGIEGKGRRFVLDHNHDTGAADGLAHFGCNRPITQRVRRYLADPPGRRLGLVVPAAKLRAIEAKDRAKRQRNRERAKEQAKPARGTGNGSFGEQTRAALRATGGT